MDTATGNVSTLTTEIEQCQDVSMDAYVEPIWKTNVKGLYYLEDYDGIIDMDSVPVEIPHCTIDATTQPVYQCIKCGNKQSNYEDIHRMKCTRCYNKAFNKIRPTKWVKFSAY